MVAKHVNKKILANHVFLGLVLFYTHMLLLLQPSVLRLSIVTFNDAKPPPKWILREFNVSKIRPLLSGLPHLETFKRQILPWLRGLPGLADRYPALAGHTTYLVNAIKLKWEIIWPGGLPHLSGLPHLPGVPHIHVNRPLDSWGHRPSRMFINRYALFTLFQSRNSYNVHLTLA